MKLEVKTRTVENQGNTVGYADVTIENCLVLKGIKIINGNNGLFLGMPSQKLNKPYKNSKGEDVQFQDHFYPITAEFREQLNKAIISGYENEFPF